MFNVDERIRSKVTGNEGTVIGVPQFVLVQFDNSEVVMIGTEQIESAPNTLPPIASFRIDDPVVCINPFWSPGLTARVLHQDGGKLWVIWDKKHWRYAGQIDGQYSTDSFAHYDGSVMSEAA
jgi:hypothetical protein